uniref:Putative mediator-associated protein 1 n=1 Tax=Davidia involucrata TaxID=16924 RepID=A0A5B6YM87_DAVIN
MAPNRRLELEAALVSSSEEGSSEENEEEQSESEEHKTSPPTPPKDKKPSASSSDDSESDSDSDSGRPVPNIKPIASKPMEEPPIPIATKKARSKPRTSAKRPIAEDSKRAKKKKKKALEVFEDDAAKKMKKTGDETEKKQLFQRLWSEEDEIAVLNGMIDYTAKKGADPVADMNAFHDFIKNKLHIINVSKTQLSDKVRRLKKKYENNARKGKKGGGERTLSKPHDQKAYELSKKIWGRGEALPNANGGDVGGIDNEKEKKNQNESISRPLGLNGSKEASKLEVEQDATLPWLVPRIGDSRLEEEIIRDGLELIEGTERQELEEKWKHLRVEEVELYLKRVELIREQTKLVLEVLKSSGH